MDSVRLGLILALLLAGCSLSASPSPSPSRGPSPSPSRSSPSEILAPAMDQAGIFAGGGFWARRGPDLFLSSDGGATWVRRAITSDPVSVFFLSGLIAWTVTPGPGSTPNTGDPAHDLLHIVVNRTTDGGATWQSVAVGGNYPDTRPVVTFADANRGYIVTAPQRFGPDAGTVLRTDDGGRSWREVGAASFLGAYLAAQPGGTALWAGADGWAGGLGPLLLQVSPDGGVSWARVDLPGLPGARSPETYLLGPPVFLSTEDGVVAVVDGKDPERVRVFRTGDGGASWSATTPVLAGNFGSPVVMSLDHWLVAAAVGASIAETTDSGATWHQIDPSGIAEPIMWFGFADALRGAALLQVGDTPAPTRLFVTTDGGHAWAPANLSPP
jgi:photosystem II stability/assembly factor-like uncharacterized protein